MSNRAKHFIRILRRLYAVNPLLFRIVHPWGVHIRLRLIFYSVWIFSTSLRVPLSHLRTWVAWKIHGAFIFIQTLYRYLARRLPVWFYNSRVDYLSVDLFRLGYLLNIQIFLLWHVRSWKIDCLFACSMRMMNETHLEKKKTVLSSVGVTDECQIKHFLSDINYSQKFRTSALDAKRVVFVRNIRDARNAFDYLSGAD